ncbi:MAG: hypothetical protein ACRD2N_24145 [Vicinamibacterales bacterium]
MRRHLLPLILLLGATSAAAQSTGPGKLELGLFPAGGTSFVGGDDDREVDFNVYSSGGNLTYYLTERAALEGEIAIGLGWGQDVFFRRAEVFHVQMPNVWSYFGNVVFFPGGTADKSAPFYVTGGIGVVSLQSRLPTKQFGYDVDTVGFESFIAENIGGGLKVFRKAAPEWGFRGDYRYLIVNANDAAPAFFAKTKSRGGHRVYFGVLFTVRR